MMRLLKLIGLLFSLSLLILSGLFFYGVREFVSPGPLSAEKDVTIARGSGLRLIADQLDREGVISHQWVFLSAAIATGRTSGIKAGEYAFLPAMPMRDVLDMLVKGDVIDRSVTVREGLTSYQVVSLVNRAPHLTGTVEDIPAEGSLLPETYHYTGNEERSALIDRMQQAMTRAMEEMWPDRDADLPFSTPQEALTLASIVEKETGVASERKRVAGVFINRLRQGMKLQTDPTVIYALTKGKHEDAGQGPLGRRLLRKDLELTDSPYNTYLYAGLPPGPIANPGRASIDAVLHPEKHDYLFFVADGTGGHVFAATAREHERNVAAWRRLRAQGR